MRAIPVETISLAPPADMVLLDRSLRSLKGFDWVVFTSPSGAECFGKRMEELSLELREGGTPKVAAVGKQTARALSSLGIEADFVPSSFTTSSLGEELPAKSGDRILLLRSEEANPVLKEKLEERGASVREAPIYRTLSVSGQTPELAEADAIVFASPSAVRSFCSLVTEEKLLKLRQLTAVCIGPVTEAAARENGFRNTLTPESFTLDGVVEAISRMPSRGA